MEDMTVNENQSTITVPLGYLENFMNVWQNRPPKRHLKSCVMICTAKKHSEGILISDCIMCAYC